MSWLTSTLTVILYSLIPLLVAYTILLALAPTAWLQRQALYANNVPVALFQRLDAPETLGFLRRQATPFRINSGTVSLYAWLITPLSLYAKHEAALSSDDAPPQSNITKSLSFRLLKDDPLSRVVIYFHGNAGTIGQSWRTDSYRLLISGCPYPVHVLAFDYRGFGRSTGSPTERGVIEDAVSVIEWVTNVAEVHPSRIVLLGQSFGTAVAVAAAHHFVHRLPRVEFAGVVLGATFSDAASVFLSYAIGGFIAPLAPLRRFPRLEKWFKGWIVDTWDSATRVQELVKRSKRLRLTFVHCVSDGMVPSGHSDLLYRLAVDAAEEALDGRVAEKRTQDLGDGGSVDVWEDGSIFVRKEMVKHGGHDFIMKWMVIPLAVYRCFGFE